jgi:hypothetical protein
MQIGVNWTGKVTVQENRKVSGSLPGETPVPIQIINFVIIS